MSPTHFAILTPEYSGPADAEVVAALDRIARSRNNTGYGRDRKLAQVFGMTDGFDGSTKARQLLEWQPLQTAFEKLRADWIQGRHGSQLPKHRTTKNLIKTAIESRHSESSEPRISHEYNKYWLDVQCPSEDWNAEDHYAGQVSSLLEKLDRGNYPPPLTWLANREVEEQRRVLFYILLFLHLEENHRLRRRLPWFKRVFVRQH